MATDLEIAWAAGVFEGEGCGSIKRTKSGRVYPTLVINMTDEDVVRRVNRIFGVGTVTGPRLRPGCKPIWRWQVTGWDPFTTVRAQISPWLGERRTKRLAEIAAEFQEPAVRGLHNLVKTHCPQGHPYDEENTLINPRGRGCRTCARAAHARWYEREKVKRSTRS